MSVALCNVAAASYSEMHLLCASDDESTATAATAGVADKAAAKAGNAMKGTDQRQITGRSSSSGSLSRKNDESDHNHETSESDVNRTQEQMSTLSVDDRPGAGGGANGVDQYWLMTTNILRDVIDGCLASATADVKSNLIKAMNNLMVSDERRAALVEGNEMSSLFELVHGYTPEVRYTVSKSVQCKSGDPCLLRRRAHRNTKQETARALRPPQQSETCTIVWSLFAHLLKVRFILPPAYHMPLAPHYPLTATRNPQVRELVARVLWNLTCERGFHSALLEADVTTTLLELLGSSSMQSTKKIPNPTTSTTMGGGGSATTASLMGSTPSSGAIHVHDGAGSTVGGEHSTIPREEGDMGEHAQDSSNGAGHTTSAGAGVGSGLDAGGAKGGGASSGGHAKGGGGKVSNMSVEVSNTESGARSASPEADGTGHTPTLEVRRNVLGAVMNLTSFSIADPRLDPKAVMSLLTLIMREDPNER